MKKYILIVIVGIIAIIPTFLFLYKPNLAFAIAYKAHLIKDPIYIANHYQNSLIYHKSQDPFVAKGSTIFIGDSIVQGLLTNRIVQHSVNYGIGGDSTHGLLNRIDLYKSIGDAKHVVIHIGINDLKKYTIDESLRNYENILNKIGHKRVILVSVLPVSKKFIEKNSDYSSEKIFKINQEIEFLAEQHQVVYANISPNFSDAEGHLKQEVDIGDGIHLSTEGYKLYIQSLKAQL